MKEKEVRELARIMDEALRSRTDKKALKRLHAEVKKLCKKFPLYR
jgi:glycine/serine hydroxymethyltransferase